MKTYCIGDRIPDPYYHWVTKRGISRSVFRKCDTPMCGYEWTNFEVPITKKWDANRRSDRCPADIHHKTRVVHGWTPNMMETKNNLSQGPQLAQTLGAVYRRRECLAEGCEVENPPRGQKTKQTRWSTLELESSGVIREDVTRCPRCDDHGKVMTVRNLDGL